MTRLFYLFCILITIGCSSGKLNEPGKYTKKCTKIYKNDFSAYNIEDYRVATARDTVIINQLKFFCVGGASTGNIIFDDFGKWAYHYELEKNNRTLVWHNIDLLSDGNKYSVYTSVYDVQPLYTSVMVFDGEENDMLSSNSNVKEKIILYFSEKIRNSDGYTAFLKEVFMTFYPDNWEEYLKKNIKYRNSLR